MQRVMLTGLVALVTTLAASGSIILDLNLSTPTIVAGQSFSVTVNLECTANEPVASLSYWLSASHTGLFTITERSYAGSAFGNMLSTDEQVCALPAAQLNPTSDANLGASAASPVSAPSSFLCTLTIQSSPAILPGLYTLYPSGGTGNSGPPGNTGFVPLVSGGTLSVLVPEPGSMALLLLSVPSALLLRRRRN